MLGVAERVQVAIEQRDEEPGGGEGEPADDEAEGEDQNVVAPLEVDEGGEYVG